MKSTILTATVLVLSLAVTASATPASARRSSQQYGMNDGKYNLKSTTGIQKFWLFGSGVTSR